MKIGFIGAGKMAQAIAGGLVREGGFLPQEILASARTNETLAQFREKVGPEVLLTADNLTVASQSEVIILAIKPQLAAEVIPLLRGVSSGKLFVSVMAGIGTARIENWLDDSARVVRSMPNTPCLIGQGMTAIASGSRSTIPDMRVVERLLRTTGKVVQVGESEMDAVTALSGSGPAYVYHFIEELIRAGVEQGLSADLARDLAIQTVSGAVGMVEASGESPGDLAARVKSPKGTTVAACEVLEKNHWGKILRSAVAAAKARAAELSQ